MIPKSVTHAEFVAAMTPLWELLGVGRRGCYVDPGMTLTGDHARTEITFTVPPELLGDNEAGVKFEPTIVGDPGYERDAVTVTVEVER